MKTGDPSILCLHLKMLLLHKLAYDLMTQNVTYRLLCRLIIIL